MISINNLLEINYIKIFDDMMTMNDDVELFN